MDIDKILILGSTLLTQRVVYNLLLDGYEHNLIGYIPNKKSTVPGEIPLDIVDWDVDYNIMLSIQFDRKAPTDKPGFNLHTGLLPDYGGLDILTHTLNEGCTEQGLTFHMMTDKFDEGPIISKITYPVLPGDTIQSLYKRQLIIAPQFVQTSLELLYKLSLEELKQCPVYKPRLLKRTGHQAPKLI